MYMKNVKSKVLLTLSLGFLMTATVVTNVEQRVFAAHPIETTTTVATPATEQMSFNQQDVHQLESKAMENNAAEKQSGGKSQLIALLLVILVGGLGIHRFYLGYTWQGVVQLLTGGGCGIWALIDLIRIITGDLKPKDGSYDKTL
jgi:TM2 domain-containing membrane protein YozV